MKVTTLLEKGFVQLCYEHAKDDFRLISEKECDRSVEENNIVKVFEKEDETDAFEAQGVKNWFLGKKAYVIAVPNFKMRRAFTIPCVCKVLNHLFEHWVQKIETMKNNMDVLYYFLPSVTIEKKLIGYKITLKMTTMSGRYID